jgi:nuclear pore complex protein Nup53
MHSVYSDVDITTKSMAQGNQRIDEAPLVPTKAKINLVLQRGSASDFGMDSMFESSRQVKPIAN